MNALLIISGLTVFLAMLNVKIWLGKKSQYAGFKHAADSERFCNDIAALNAGTIGLGERLLKIERQQKLLIQRLEQLELYAGGDQSYAQAINLVKQGINKQDLMATCELSDAEAGLLMMMHKQQQKNKAVFSH